MDSNQSLTPATSEVAPPQKRSFNRLIAKGAFALFLVALGGFFGSLSSDADYEESIRNLKGQLDQTNLMNQDLESKNSQFNEAIRSEQNKNKSLSDDMEQLTGKHKKLTEEHDKLTKEHNALKDQFTKVKSDLNDLDIRYTQLGSEHSHLKNKQHHQSEMAKWFSKKAYSRSINLSSRALKNIPGKMVPFIGTSIVVANTALDIKDMCEMVMDINKLKESFDLAKEDEGFICNLR